MKRGGRTVSHFPPVPLPKPRQPSRETPSPWGRSELTPNFTVDLSTRPTPRTLRLGHPQPPRTQAPGQLLCKTYPIAQNSRLVPESRTTGLPTCHVSFWGPSLQDSPHGSRLQTCPCGPRATPTELGSRPGPVDLDAVRAPTDPDSGTTPLNSGSRLTPAPGWPSQTQDSGRSHRPSLQAQHHSSTCQARLCGPQYHAGTLRFRTRPVPVARETGLTPVPGRPTTRS